MTAPSLAGLEQCKASLFYRPSPIRYPSAVQSVLRFGQLGAQGRALRHRSIQTGSSRLSMSEHSELDIRRPHLNRSSSPLSSQASSRRSGAVPAYREMAYKPGTRPA